MDPFATLGFERLYNLDKTLLDRRYRELQQALHPDKHASAPASERALTLAEVQEMQVRLTKAGFNTGGTDGRVGNDTMQAIRDYQTRMGLLPADGYGGLKVLARLRQGS